MFHVVQFPLCLSEESLDHFKAFKHAFLSYNLSEYLLPPPPPLPPSSSWSTTQNAEISIFK